jgi:hypothetical protein
VAFVSPSSEVADLQAHMRVFLADPARYARLGRAGRRILEERHAPELYVQTLLDLVELARRQRTRPLAYQLGERVATEMSAWTEGSHLADRCRRVAEEMHRLAG